MNFVKLGTVFVVIMVAVSAAFNFTFGWRLGENSHTVTELFHDGFIYGALSISSDGFKICLGVLTFLLLFAKTLHWSLRIAGTLFCGILFLAATAYSLNSAMGTISQNRTDMAGLREAKATNYDALKTQLKRVQDEQGWLDQKYRAAGAVKADMARERQSYLWTRTAGCTDATVPESREFCQRYAGLRSELATAERAEALATRADALRTKLAGTGGKIIADPHAKFLHDLSGYDQNTIVLAWLLLLVVLVEGGSTLGPIVVWLGRIAAEGQMATEAAQKPVQRRSSPPPNPTEKTKKPAIGENWREKLASYFLRSEKPAKLPEPSKPAVIVDNTTRSSKPSLRGPVKRWVQERLTTTAVGGGTTGTFHADYAQWCRRHGYTAFNISHFGRQLNKLGLPRVGKQAGASRPGWKLKTEVGLSAARAA